MIQYTQNRIRAKKVQKGWKTSSGKWMKTLPATWNKAMVRATRLRITSMTRNKITCMEKMDGKLLAAVLSGKNGNNGGKFLTQFLIPLIIFHYLLKMSFKAKHKIISKLLIHPRMLLFFFPLITNQNMLLVIRMRLIKFWKLGRRPYAMITKAQVFVHPLPYWIMSTLRAGFMSNLFTPHSALALGTEKCT